MRSAPEDKRRADGTAMAKNILVVDDHAPTRALIRTVLESEKGTSFQVIEAATGTECLKAMDKKGPFDLILLDVNLPDTTGIELCRALRAAGIETDVIAVTAVRDAAVVRSAVSLGIVQYLIKPFGFAAFAEKLTAYRDYHARVGTAVVTDQQEVDASFAALRTSSGGDLPKGLTRETLDRVRAAVRAAPASAVSATELAGALDLSRVTARRYLEHLADSGVVERASRYGAPGRPEVEYRLR